MTKNKITEGNAFALNIRQAVWRTLGGVIQPLLASELVDVHLYVGIGTSRITATEYNVTADGDTINAVMPATLKRGVYRTWLTAIYNGREVASNCDAAFEIVAFDEHYQAYAPERVDAPMAVYLQPADVTDAELEQLKAEFRAKNAALDAAKAAAEQARQEYIAKAEELESVASRDDVFALTEVLSKEATSESIKTDTIFIKDKVVGLESDGKKTEAILSLLNKIYNGNFFISKNVDGYTLKETSVKKPAILNLIDEYKNIVSIDDDDVEDIYEFDCKTLFPNIKYVRLSNVKRMGLKGGNYGSFDRCAYLKKVICPKLESSSDTNFIFRGCSELELVDYSNIMMGRWNNHLSGKSVFSGCTKLIDLICGKNHESIDYDLAFTTWNPTEALLEDSTSLVESNESFSSNREKLNHNIREHIAENLPIISGTGNDWSVLFHANMFAALEEETISRFVNKGWNVASL